MNISIISVVTLLLVINVQDAGVFYQSEIEYLEADTVWKKSQLIESDTSEPIIFAGNTACNPRAQVCED